MEYYFRTRGGRRERVRIRSNRLRATLKPGQLLLSGRATLGNLTGLGSVSARRDGRNIREVFDPSLTRNGLGLRARGNIGDYQLRTRLYVGRRT